MNEEHNEQLPHGIRRWATLFVFAAILGLPILTGAPGFFFAAVAVIVIFLLIRDYGIPWYRNPSIPASLRKRKLTKVLYRFGKWIMLLPVVLMGVPLLVARLHLPGPGHPDDLYAMLFLMVFALAAVALEVADRRLKWPRPVGCCQQCGYNLTGNVSGRCPECGVAIGADWLDDSDQKGMTPAPTPPETCDR